MQRSFRGGHPGPTILIVDDDPAVRNSLQFSLEVEGFPVRTYSDGADFLKEATFPEIGCLVIDYQLPGISGLELLTQLRGRKVTLPAVLVTTRPNAIVQLRAAEAGVPIIEKPLLTEDLFQCIQMMLVEAGNRRVPKKFRRRKSCRRPFDQDQ